MGASTFDRQWLPVGQARSAIWGEGEEGYNIFTGRLRMTLLLRLPDGKN